MINIVIADDHKIVLEGLASLIESDKSIKIVGEAETGNQVLEILQKNDSIDLVVLDIEMPDMDGVETTRFIRKKFPDIKVLILTMYNKIGFIRKIIEAGAQGYILKNKGKEELLYAIHEIMGGNEYFGKDVSKALIDSMKNEKVEGEIKLTKREIQVLKFIADGKTTKEIADILIIGETTVNTHRKNLLAKTGYSNVAGLVRFAFEYGYAN
jgi:two-component system nitrate/nitrite response regulator NarL